MAAPARTPPSGEPNNEALDILRRLEPTLARMTADLGEVKTDIKRLDERQRKQSEDIAEIKGRLGGVETRMSGLLVHALGL